MLSAIRASVFFTGLQWYRRHGFYERYLQLVEPNVLEVILSATTNEWLTVNVLEAHYRAAERLDMTVDEQLDLGESVASALYSPTLRTLAQLAGKLGVSPWLGLARAPKLWGKTSCGGGLRVERLDGRSALVIIYKVPFSNLRLYRNAAAGLFRGGARVFTASPQVAVDYDPTRPTTFGIRVRWLARAACGALEGQKRRPFERDQACAGAVSYTSNVTTALRHRHVMEETTASPRISRQPRYPAKNAGPPAAKRP